MTDAEYIAWMTGTLQGVGAPVDSINNMTLWSWSGAEGGRVHMNPLNTTEWEPGAVAWNTLGSGAHVWTFPDVATAVQATVATLLNGHYPTIVAHLRGSVPRQLWGDACRELGVWGTGCAWIDEDFGSPPVFGPVPGGNALTDSELRWAHDVSQLIAFGTVDTSAQSYADFAFAVGQGQTIENIMAGWRSSAAGQAWTAKLEAAGGAQGPQGIQGPVGPPGPPGPEGPPGPTAAAPPHNHALQATTGPAESLA